MKTRLLIIISFGLIGLAGGHEIPQAFGLSCGIPLFIESYERHDLLLHGKLVEKEILVPVWENQKLTTLSFDTIKVYKGEFSKTFTIKANLSWDDYYREGEEYVLFANKDGSDYFRDLCVPDYLASKSIIKFLDEHASENQLESDVTSLYDVVRGFERDDLDLKLGMYANQNRNDTAGSGYVVETSDYAITWFGALQILIILAVIGISTYLIFRRKKK
ncbi:MAG: hypothetical protein ACE5DL_00240 [Nitrosopumilaceae archaeon]